MTREEALDVLTGWLPLVKLRKYKAAIQVAIDALSTPELPSELEEAAFAYENQLWESGFKDCGYSPKEVNDAFKAGAKWGKTRALERVVKWMRKNPTYTHPRKGMEICMVNIRAFLDVTGIKQNT